MFKYLIDFYQRKITRSQKARWNHQYAAGKWEGLKEGIEIERQEIVRNMFFQWAGESKSLIEFGCGYGVIPDVIFKKEGYSHYQGVDVSDYIISEIQKLSDSRHVFEVGDMENYHFTEKYDVILFNECINYAKDIPKLLNDCIENGLKPNGVFIISVHFFKRSPEIWRDIHANLEILEIRHLGNTTNKWQIETLKPKI